MKQVNSQLEGQVHSGESNLDDPVQDMQNIHSTSNHAPPSLQSSVGVQPEAAEAYLSQQHHQPPPFPNSNESVERYSGSQTIMDSFLDISDCPFQKWLQYLPGEQYSPTSNLIHCLQAAREFFLKSTKLDKSEELHERRFFDVDLKQLIKDPRVLQTWPLIKEDLEDRAEKVSGILGLARHQMIEDELQNDGVTTAFPLLRARLIKHSPITPLKMLKSCYFGKLVTIRGTVIRMSSIQPMFAWMEFQCPSCFTDQVVYQPKGKNTAPVRCLEAGCRASKNFQPKRASKKTITVNAQNIRLQEIVQDDGGRVPRTIECELTEDLCDNCVPGDVITLTGVVKVVASEEELKKAKSNKSMFLLYISTLNLSKSRSKGSRGSNIDIEFTINDYAAIQEIQALGENIFKVLANSLCPSIYGHELVKAGLLLGLFGGTNKPVGDRTHLSVRGDPHILVVGNPGLGKSQILQSTSDVAPRSVFVTGNTTTTSGLTFTLTSEAGNDFALEAGALVLADQGCCCIDEFDKITSQHQALLEVMDQQCISVVKAGVVCTLSARTAVLAAANPVGGYYNHSKTVADNLKLDPTLVSKFDLVFILMKTPNEQMGGLLSEHGMACNLPQNTIKLETFLGPTQPHTISTSAALADRLKCKAGELKEPIPHPILRKYIAYARKYVFPKLSKEACDVLKNFYFELKQKRQTSDSTSITTRVLESLIRLTEARAKLQLSEEATEQDALDVVEIMKLSILETVSTPSEDLSTRSKPESTPSENISITSCPSDKTSEGLNKTKIQLNEESTEQDALDVVEIIKESILETVSTPSEDLSTKSCSKPESTSSEIVSTPSENISTPSCPSNKSAEGVSKTGRKKLIDQKRRIEDLYKKKITKEKQPGGGFQYKCTCDCILKTKAQASRHVDKCKKKMVLKKKKKAKPLKLKCNICEFRSRTRKDMNLHRKQSHEEVASVFKCRKPGCGSLLNSVQHLRIHMRIHTEKRTKHQCPCCPKEFVEVGGRNRHTLSNHKDVLTHIAVNNSNLKTDLNLLVSLESDEEGVLNNMKIKREVVFRIIEALKKEIVCPEEEKECVVVGVPEEEEEEEFDVIPVTKEEEKEIGGVADEKKIKKPKENDVRELSEYERIREKNIEERKAFFSQLKIDELKEAVTLSLPRKRKIVPLKPSLLPTRRSSRLIVRHEEKVLAPELIEYLNTSVPLPIRQLRYLPKTMRVKPMPRINFPDDSTNPPLPIRFYACTPLSFNEVRCAESQCSFLPPQGSVNPSNSSTSSTSTSVLISPSSSKPGTDLSFSPSRSISTESPPLKTDQSFSAEETTPKVSGSGKESSLSLIDLIVSEAALKAASQGSGCLVAPTSMTANDTYSYRHSTNGQAGYTNPGEPRVTSGIDPETNVDESFSGLGREYQDAGSDLQEANYGESFDDHLNLSLSSIGSENFDFDMSDNSEEVGKFYCQLCDYKNAADNRDLNRHIIKMHNVREEALRCSKFWCSESFKTRFELKKHQSDCKFITCSEENCNFKLKYKSQVEPHHRMHLIKKSRE